MAFSRAVKTNSTELEKAIQRLPTTPGFYIAYSDSRAPTSGHTDNLRATVEYLLASFEPELIQMVATNGMALSIRLPP